MSKTNQLRRWELALMLGLAFTMLSGLWVSGAQNQLASHMIRLHVLANSDTPADQALKLEVRDAILAASADLVPADTTLDQARVLLTASLPTLAQVGQEVVARAGYDYPVTASLADDVWFPTKTYTDFALPAGTYTALQISIGAGAGQNWWCVVFPPLCLGSVSEQAVTVVSTDNLTQQDVALMTGENQGYVLKFKSMELWDDFKAWVD